MRILRPFHNYIVKFVLWPEEVIYISFHARPGVLAKIAALETPQSAIDLMAARGDTCRVLELYERFDRKTDMVSSFAYASQASRISTVKTLAKFVNHVDICREVGYAVLSNDAQIVRCLVRMGGQITWDRLARIKQLGHDNLVKLFHKVPSLSSEIKYQKYSNAEWRKRKYNMLHNAIMNDMKHALHDLHKMGFNNRRIILNIAMETGSIMLVKYLCKRLSILVIADYLYILEANYYKIISYVANRLDLNVRRAILTENLAYYVCDVPDGTLISEKINAFIACGANPRRIDLHRITGARNREIFMSCID